MATTRTPFRPQKEKQTNNPPLYSCWEYFLAPDETKKRLIVPCHPAEFDSTRKKILNTTQQWFVGDWRRFRQQRRILHDNQTLWSLVAYFFTADSVFVRVIVAFGGSEINFLWRSTVQHNKNRHTRKSPNSSSRNNATTEQRTPSSPTSSNWTYRSLTLTNTPNSGCLLRCLLHGRYAHPYCWSWVVVAVAAVDAVLGHKQ